MNVPLTDSKLMAMTAQDMNDGLKSYRPDLRYSRADAVRFVELWNTYRVHTEATLISDGGEPYVIIADRPD